MNPVIRRAVPTHDFRWRKAGVLCHFLEVERKFRFVTNWNLKGLRFRPGCFLPRWPRENRANLFFHPVEKIILRRALFDRAGRIKENSNRRVGRCAFHHPGKRGMLQTRL